jgi:hypothetical protein
MCFWLARLGGLSPVFSVAFGIKAFYNIDFQALILGALELFGIQTCLLSV